MRVEAIHGYVVITTTNDEVIRIPREEMISGLAELASAIHMAGDISDPFGVEFAEQTLSILRAYGIKS